jgi:hypothetical protein
MFNPIVRKHDFDVSSRAGCRRFCDALILVILSEGGLLLAAVVEGPVVRCWNQSSAMYEQQVLRLRVRPIRKTSGSKRKGGRSAQDDNSEMVVYRVSGGSR